MDVSYAESAVADVLGEVEWVQHDKRIAERTVIVIGPNIDGVSFEVAHGWVEANAVEVEKAGQVATEGGLLVLVELV